MTDCPTRSYKIPESVLVVIYTAELEVLLIERADYPGFWQSVTGSKDYPDEPLVDTAIREVAEETGIVIARKPVKTLAVGPERDIIGREDGMIRPVARAHLRDWQLSNVYDIYPTWRHRYAPGVTRNTEHVFGLMVPRDVPVLLSPREHLRHCWRPYREAADQCFSPSNAEAILQLPRYAFHPAQLD